MRRREHPWNIRLFAAVKPSWGVRDHQPVARQTTPLERAQKLTPQGLGLAVAHGNAQHLAVAEGIDADRHHHRPRHHLQVAAQTAVEVRRIEVNVGEMGVVQRFAQKGLDPLIKALADAAQLRFGDAAVAAQGLHQGIQLVGE